MWRAPWVGSKDLSHLDSRPGVGGSLSLPGVARVTMPPVKASEVFATTGTRWRDVGGMHMARSTDRGVSSVILFC